jgi:hypothetical protein
MRSSLLRCLAPGVIASPNERISRAHCDAEWIGSLEDAQPARITATVTPRIRRQVLARDLHRCAVPGCRSARNLDLRHIEYQRDGGRHELANLELARKFGEPSTRHPIVDVDLVVVVVVDLDGDGGVALVGGGALTVELNPDATAGEPCRSRDGC